MGLLKGELRWDNEGEGHVRWPEVLHAPLHCPLREA